MYESDGYMVPYPGYKKILELAAVLGSTGQGRGFFVSVRTPIAIAVKSSSVWIISSSFGMQFVGTLKTSTGPVFMDENLNGQIGIVDSVNLYIYNKFNNSLTQQTGDLYLDLTPNFIKFHDGYFLIGNGNKTGNGAKFYALVYKTDDTVDVAIGGELALETSPDYALAACPLSEHGNMILVFGSSVTEVQMNTPKTTGLQTILYQRVPTINISYGVASVATIDTSDGVVMWLAINKSSPPVLMVFDGQSHDTITTDGFNYLLERVKSPSESFGFFFKSDGKLFYQLTMYGSEDNFSILVNVKERKIYNVSDWNLNFHPARQVVYYQGKNYFISWSTGDIYNISTDHTTYDENIVRVGSEGYKKYLDHIIPRQIIGDTWRPQGVMTRPFCVRRISIVMEQGEDKDYSKLYDYLDGVVLIEDEDGTPLVTDDGKSFILAENSQDFRLFGSNIKYSPGVDFSFSKDGCATWSNEKRRRLNFIGKRQNITKWPSLGRMNEFTPKFKFWGKCRFVVGNGTMEVMN